MTEFVTTKFIITEFIINEFVITEFIITELNITEFIITKFHCIKNWLLSLTYTVVLVNRLPPARTCDVDEGWNGHVKPLHKYDYVIGI